MTNSRKKAVLYLLSISPLRRRQGVVNRNETNRGGQLRLCYRCPLEPYNLPLGPRDREVSNKFRAKLFEPGGGCLAVVVLHTQIWDAPLQWPGRSFPPKGRRHYVQLVDVVKHVVEDAHSEPCVVDTLSRLEEDLSLEHPESPLHSSIAALDVLAHALQPPAPVMLLYCGVLLDRWHE